MDVMNCQGLAVPMTVMQHVVNVESSFNPYAIGVVGAHLRRQPATLPEAVSTARMLESRGYDFSLGLAQVNRRNLAKYGLVSYEMAFQACPNLRAGARILADCHARSSNDWGRSFSCYYSGDFVTGFRQGYVRKVFASVLASRNPDSRLPTPIAVIGGSSHGHGPPMPAVQTTLSRRVADSLAARVPTAAPSVADVSRSPPRQIGGDTQAIASTPAMIDSNARTAVSAPVDSAFVF